MGQKRKPVDPEASARFSELPRATLLHLRRQLSLQPLSEALKSVELAFMEGELAALAAQLAGALQEALGGDLWCWDYDEAAIQAARSALRTMLSDGRQELLEALRAGEPFCSTVKRYSSKRDGEALMKLGQTRLMWLLGAGPEEATASKARKRPRKRPVRCDSDSESGDDAETRSFLESMKRAKR